MSRTKPSSPKNAQRADNAVPSIAPNYRNKGALLVNTQYYFRNYRGSRLKRCSACSLCPCAPQETVFSRTRRGALKYSPNSRTNVSLLSYSTSSFIAPARPVFRFSAPVSLGHEAPSGSPPRAQIYSGLMQTANVMLMSVATALAVLPRNTVNTEQNNPGVNRLAPGCDLEDAGRIRAFFPT